MQRFPVIIGPTAGGKSDLAINIAEALGEPGELGGEIVSADSMQIYRGLDIGSAKPTPEQRRRVPHHLIDIREPTERFSVDEWLEPAESAIEDIRSRRRIPIVVGGTHLYIKALLEGLFEGPPPDPALRQSLQSQPAETLRAELERDDPAAARRIHPNDIRRTVRALEVKRTTGRPISDWQRQWDQGGVREDALLVALTWPAERTNQRINARVKQMVERGLVEEARRLWEAGRLGPQAGEGLGYKQLTRHFEGNWTLEEAIEQIKIETRRLAKNQRTWIRRLLGSVRSASEQRAGPPSPIIIQADQEPKERSVDRVLGLLKLE